MMELAVDDLQLREILISYFLFLNYIVIKYWKFLIFLQFEILLSYHPSVFSLYPSPEVGKFIEKMFGYASLVLSYFFIENYC